jgi:cholest-4-en-3-one 26-monooxygenase
LAAAATYQAVIDAERNPELSSNAGGIRPETPGMPYMIDMDDPAHLLRRKLVNAGFTRKRVMEKEPSIATLCDTLIDAVCERGECDFVRDIAAPLRWMPSPHIQRSRWKPLRSAAVNPPMTYSASW